MADAQAQVLLERLRSREEELKKREKDVKLRDQQLKERAEELDSARTSADALFADLTAREAAIAETERKHGTVAAREEEAIVRDVALSEREAQVQDKLAEMARKERESALALRQRQRALDLRAEGLDKREEELVRKEKEFAAKEDEVEAKRKQLHKSTQEAEALATEKERQLREMDAQTAADRRKLMAQQYEFEQNSADLQEKWKMLRAEYTELESRMRDVKWQDEGLRAAHEQSTKKRQELQKWEKAVAARDDEVKIIEATLVMREDSIDMRENEVALRLTKFVAAEKELSARERALKKSVEILEKRTAECDKMRADVELKEEEAQRRYDESVATQERCDAIGSEVAARLEEVEVQARIIREKERALKDWLVELEFREAAIAKREGNPRGYLHGSGGTYVEGSGGWSSPGGNESHFNSAVVSMQLQQLQGAYLGATLKQRNIRTQQKEKDRTVTEVPQSDAVSHKVEATAATLEVDHELQLAETAFRDLVSGFVCLTHEERSRLLQPEDEATVVNAAEFEAEVFDEHEFLDSLFASPLPAIDLSCSPNDSKLFGLVTKWINERAELLAQRKRRLNRRRLVNLRKAIAVLEGKVRPREERRKAFQLPYCDGSPGQLSAGFKARARTRLPAVMVAGHRAATPDTKIKTPLESPKVNQRTNQSVPSTPSPTASRAMRRAARLQPERSAKEKLVDALPTYLQCFYSFTPEGTVNPPTPQAGVSFDL